MVFNTDLNVCLSKKLLRQTEVTQDTSKLAI